jgi:hypothetical protein
MGFGCRALRRFHPAGGWPVRFHTLPGPRVVSASAAAPIYFRRGDPSFARGSETLASDRKKAKANRGRVGVRLLGFNSRLRSARRHARTGLVVRWCARGGLRSCLGLSLSQGFGHDLPCTVRARPGTIHQPPAGCRRTHRRRADPSARLTRLGLWNVLPDRPAPAERPPSANRPRDDIAAGGVRPFSVFGGLMPCRSDIGLAPASQRLPV